jgi:hypothetical protein
MTEFRYNIFYKAELPLDGRFGGRSWDVYLSAYNLSERVKIIFDRISARKKYWLVHNEYGFTEDELPPANVFRSIHDNEAPFILDLCRHIKDDCGVALKDLDLCIDITGFMRPHLLFLAMYLHDIGVRKYDVIYSEPQRYAKKENTTFSEGGITVRQIAGFEGYNSPDQSNDFLIIGSGYDSRLIKAVAEVKDKADKVQIYGLPSLRADMYQENVLNAYKAADAIGRNKLFDKDSFFAPANDPFITAEALHEIVEQRNRWGPISNLYLSPLATKPQALGFALFYLAEYRSGYASILFPVSTRYSQETSTGLSRVWQYTVEYPIL